jgi:hypothetical protein
MCRVALLLSLALGRVLAQTSTGAIDGIVVDSSGAAVPGARIRLLGTETGELVRDLATGGDGAFAAPLLRPMAYTVEVTAQGFKKLVRPGIVLRVDDALNLRLALEIGAASDAVTVSATVDLLEETTNTVGQTIDDRTMQQLPLNGRNYLQLGNLSAGTLPDTRTRDLSFSAYGNRGLQNAFLLDGARNQNYLRGLDNRARDAMRPSLEAISEFKVQTSNYSAEYGASAGAVVTVVTKSGTNEFHGSAFEFLRNSAFDARDYFQPAALSKPLFVEHQFGGSVGGRVVKNRAWWHAAYQRTHISQGSKASGAVPLPQERNGQFSVPVFDPMTTIPNPAGSGSLRDPFPNNTIPANRFDKIGKGLVNRYPDPLLAGAVNYSNNPLNSTRTHNATVRGDVKLSDRNSLFVRWSLDQGSFHALPLLPEGAQTGVVRDVPARSYGVGYTRIVSPAVVNEARFAYNEVGLTQDATQPLEDLIPGALAPTVRSGMPTFNVTGYAGIGTRPANFDNVPVTKDSSVYNLSDNLSIVHGKRTTKIGFDFQDIITPTFATLDGRGSFGFTGVFTQNPQRRPGSGSSIADLLLGLPNSITTGTASDAHERARNYYFYLQNDWNISPQFTLNAGVRYEITSPFWDENNRLANLILDSGDPLYGQYVLAGDSRVPRALQSTAHNNFAPRLGFAWKGPARTVIRSGAGIFFAQDEGFGVSQRMTNNPPFVGFGGYSLVSDQLNISSTIPLSGALPARPAPPDPAAFKFDPKALTQIRSWGRRFTIPYVAQWNLSIQRELTRNLLWEVAYVGNHGTKLYGAYEGNQPVPGPGSVNTRRPLAGVVTAASVLNVAPWVTSSYEGVSTRLERRFASGLSLLGVYTFGKALDMQTTIDLCDGCTNSSGNGAVSDTRNRRLNYGLSDAHTAHRMVVSGLWEIPIGKGRRLLPRGAAAAIAGGWAVAGITTLSSGLPITLNLSFDNANTGTVNWPDRIAKGTLSHPAVGAWFDTAAFVFPTPYTIGNAGRNYLTGPGTVSTDASLQRNFRVPLREPARLEFRAEAFNLFNAPQLGQPGLTLGTAQFGVISSTARPNRQMQLGLKLLW